MRLTSRFDVLVPSADSVTYNISICKLTGDKQVYSGDKDEFDSGVN